MTCVIQGFNANLRWNAFSLLIFVIAYAFLLKLWRCWGCPLVGHLLTIRCMHHALHININDMDYGYMHFLSEIPIFTKIIKNFVFLGDFWSQNCHSSMIYVDTFFFLINTFFTSLWRVCFLLSFLCWFEAFSSPPPKISLRTHLRKAQFRVDSQVWSDL